MTALEGDEQRAVFMSDVERRMSGDRVTGSGDSFADGSAVPLLEMIQARTEGRELTGAAAEYAQETERRTAARRKVCMCRWPLSRPAPHRPRARRRASFPRTSALTSLSARCAMPGDAFVGGASPAGLRGNVVIPKFKSDMSAGWVAENEALSDSGMDFNDLVTLKPRHVGAITELPRQLIQQSSPDITAGARRPGQE